MLHIDVKKKRCLFLIMKVINVYFRHFRKFILFLHVNDSKRFDKMVSSASQSGNVNGGLHRGQFHNLHSPSSILYMKMLSPLQGAIQTEQQASLTNHIILSISPCFIYISMDFSCNQQEELGKVCIFSIMLEVEAPELFFKNSF